MYQRQVDRLKKTLTLKIIKETIERS